VVRKEEDRQSYSLLSASGDHVSAHHLDRRLFNVEDANNPRALSTFELPSPNRVDHLTFPLSLGGTPDQLSSTVLMTAFADRCAVRDTLLADGATEIDLRARGPYASPHR